MKKKNPHIGSLLDDFLKDEGVLEETHTLALKETLAWHVEQAMKKSKINKSRWCGGCTRAPRHWIAYLIREMTR